MSRTRQLDESGSAFFALTVGQTHVHATLEALAPRRRIVRGVAFPPEVRRAIEDL